MARTQVVVASRYGTTLIAAGSYGAGGRVWNGQGTANPTYPGLAQRRQRAGFKTPSRFNFVKAPDCGAWMASFRSWGHSLSRTHLGLIWEELTRTRRPAGDDVSDPIRSLGAVLIDTVARLQLDLNPCVIRHGVDRFRRGGLVR